MYTPPVSTHCAVYTNEEYFVLFIVKLLKKKVFIINIYVLYNLMPIERMYNVLCIYEKKNIMNSAQSVRDRDDRMTTTTTTTRQVYKHLCVYKYIICVIRKIFILRMDTVVVSG